MCKYIIKNFQKGFEQDQVRIGFEVSRNWIWPYAYDLEDLLRIHSRPDFDPDTRHYCFFGDEMVGYMVCTVAPPAESGDTARAWLDFPRMLPGHEQAAELLIEKAFKTLADKKVLHIESRVTTMCPDDIELAEKTGFSIFDWGYKVYYSYEMEWGPINVHCDEVDEIDPEKDMDDCARIAAYWYKQSPEWCRTRLKEWFEAGIITNPCVRDQGKLIAACMVAPNNVRSSTAGIYYIYAPDNHTLRPMLAKVVNKCIDYGTKNVIADLINEHRQFESVYQELGFRKAAEWARCEKQLGVLSH